MRSLRLNARLPDLPGGGGVYVMLAWRKLFLQCGCPYLSVPQRIRTKGEYYSADKIFFELFGAHKL